MGIQFIQGQLDKAYTHLDKSVVPRARDIETHRGNIEGRVKVALQHLEIVRKLLTDTDTSYTSLVTALADCELETGEVRGFFERAETDESANIEVRSLAASCVDMEDKVHLASEPFLEDPGLPGRLRARVGELADECDTLLDKAVGVRSVVGELGQQALGVTNNTERIARHMTGW